VLCDDQCRWGDSGECVINTDCSPGDTVDQDCGQCGRQRKACGAQCLWDEPGACQDEGPCAPGDTESEICGNCGTHVRVCAPDCQWGAFDHCVEPANLECAPNDVEARTCGCLDPAAVETRTCTNACTWDVWGGCPCVCDVAGVRVCEFEVLDACEDVLREIVSCEPDGAGSCSETIMNCG